jgi:hypothetical protein
MLAPAAICFSRQSREFLDKPIHSRLPQQIVRILQRQVVGNVTATGEPSASLRFRQSCCPRFIKFAHIRLPMVS